MSQIVDDLRQVAIEIKTETQVGGNTAARVGGAFERVADALEGTQQIEDMDAAVAAVQQAAQENEQTIQNIVNSLAVVQITGQSTGAVMSQKAVTDELQDINNDIISYKTQYYLITATSGTKIFPFPFVEGRKYYITAKRVSGDARATICSYSSISGANYVELTRLEEGVTENSNTFIANTNKFIGLWSSSGSVTAEIEIKWEEGYKFDVDFYEEIPVEKETFFNCISTSTRSYKFAISLTQGKKYRYKVTYPSSIGWDGGATSNSSSASILQRGALIKNEIIGTNMIQTFEIVCDANYGGFYSYLNAEGSVTIEFSEIEIANAPVNRCDIIEDRFKDEDVLINEANIITAERTWSRFVVVNLNVGVPYQIVCTVDENSPLTADCGILLKKEANTQRTGEVTIASLISGFYGTKITRYVPQENTNYRNLCIWSSAAGNNINVKIIEDIKGDIAKRFDTIEECIDISLNPIKYGAIYDGQTDCSAALQECLDRGGEIRLTGNGRCLLNSSVYIKKSNTHLIIDEGITIVRGSNASGALIRNEASTFPYDDERVNSNILDKIVIEGGTINLANRGGLAIFLCDISNFELRNIKIKNSSGFGLLFANVYGFNIDNVVFDYSNPVVNTDGMHFRGDIKDGVIQHIYGNTGDDLISLTPTGDYNTAAQETRRGILDNVVVRDLFGKNAMCAIKLNTGVDTPMKKIVIDGIYGHYTYNPISIGNWMESAVFEDITLKNIHCTCDNQTNVSFEGFIRIADWHSGNTTVIENLSIVDSYIKVTHSMNIIRNVGHTINNLMLSNIVVDVDDISLSSRSVLNGGTINRLIANNVLVKAPATASKFNKFFNCSTMPKALLSNCDLYVNSLGSVDALYTSNTLVNDNEI